MRWTIKTLLACAALPLAPLGAQEGGVPPAPPAPEERAAEKAPPPAPDMWTHVLERFDRNGDGAITREDFEGMKAPMPRGRGPMGPGMRGQEGRRGPGPQAEDWRELARELFAEHPQLRQRLQQRRGQQREPWARRGPGQRFGSPGRMQGRGPMGPRGMGPGAWGRGPGGRGQMDPGMWDRGQRGRGQMGPGMRGRGQRGPGRMGPGGRGFGGACPHCGQQPFGPGFGPPPWAGGPRR